MMKSFDSPLRQNQRVITLQKIKHGYVSDIYISLENSLHNGAKILNIIIFWHMVRYGRKLNDLQKVAEIYMTNSRSIENFLCGKKTLTRQKIRSYVTLGNMLNRQAVNEAICYQAKCDQAKCDCRQNVTWQNVAEPFLRLLDTNGQTDN